MVRTGSSEAHVSLETTLATIVFVMTYETSSCSLRVRLFICQRCDINRTNIIFRPCCLRPTYSMSLILILSLLLYFFFFHAVIVIERARHNDYNNRTTYRCIRWSATYCVNARVPVAVPPLATAGWSKRLKYVCRLLYSAIPPYGYVGSYYIIRVGGHF